MGQEITTTPLEINQFLGLNNNLVDTAIDSREASALQNVNITDESVGTRLGSTKKNSTAFQDQTDTTAVEINGLYEGKLGGTIYQVGVGGDAFKSFAAGAWTDRTGAVTITDDPDIQWSFATFLDGSAANEIIIGANGSNPPIKWTGSGDAAALATPPGNFNFPVVHKNKLWVAINDIVYFSAIRDGESWDTSDDLIRFENNGEDITGLISYNDRLIVCQPSAVWVVSGSSNRNLNVAKIVTADGFASHLSLKEVTSRRYGNIIIGLSSEGILKGFNGSKNLIDLGEPARSLFNEMNYSRHANSVSGVIEDLGQYWISMTYGSGSTNNQIIIYDFKRDYLTNEKGRPLSSILYHVGIKANAMATWTESGRKVLITGDYNGFALKQNDGRLDEGANAIISLWQSKKHDFGTKTRVKLLTDLALVSTQSTETNMSISVTSDNYSGNASLTIPVSGGLWGSMVWGTGLWSAASTKYTRAKLTNTDPDSERAVSGRYFQAQMNHNSSNEAMNINELILGATDLGQQPEYVE